MDLERLAWSSGGLFPVCGCWRPWRRHLYRPEEIVQHVPKAALEESVASARGDGPGSPHCPRRQFWGVESIGRPNKHKH